MKSRVVYESCTIPLNGLFMSEDFREWLRSKVAVQRKTGCWEFTGAKDHAGFGRVFIGGREVKAPRVFYQAFVAEIPAGAKLIHHLGPGRCIGPACCNPAHVRVVRSWRVEPLKRTCPKGHTLDSDNSVVESRGTKLRVRCRICKNNGGGDDE